jgi:hypothetical protein
MEREGIIFDKSICTQANTVEQAKSIILRKWENLMVLQSQGMRISDASFDILHKALLELVEITDATRLAELRETLEDITEDTENSEES